LATCALLVGTALADPFSDIIVNERRVGRPGPLRGPTGAKRPFPLKGMELAFGPDGHLYVYGQQGWHELVARFDLEPWGRPCIPNARDCYVAVVDNAGNEILRFGYYGNPDSVGPQSPVPEPDVPLGGPMAVRSAQVERGRLYVADTM